MKVVVDTNIVFSGMLNTNNHIANILVRTKTKHPFYSTEQLRIEIENYSDKLMIIAKCSEHGFRRVFSLFTRKIQFVNRQFIPHQFYHEALSLTKDVDIDDTEFVALTMCLDGRFWSGDKILKKWLVDRDWDKFVTMGELMRNQAQFGLWLAE